MFTEVQQFCFVLFHFIKWRKINTLSCSLIISINLCKTTTRYNYHLIIPVTIKKVYFTTVTLSAGW